MLHTPPSHKAYFINLPLARLHVLETGRGAPLIMVPATISELQNWLPLAQFMGQWFHVYFFELPGHGQSEPFREPFSSQRVAQLVEQLADELGFERFSLMGFSFGGMLAMQTFKRLSARIDRVVFIAPCLDHRALPFSAFRLSILYKFNQFLSDPKMQSHFYQLIHNEFTVSLVVKLLQKVGHLENTVLLQKKLLHTTPGTISVLNAQISEILTAEFEVTPAKHQTPCYFAMSVYDPLLRFDITLNVVYNHFEHVKSVPLFYPFHQPPGAFTYEELNRNFYKTVDEFICLSA
ncbi:MAG TPA: alpha/beta hydrolase [Anaerolineales bacterium]